MTIAWNIRVTDRRGRAKVQPMPPLPLVLGRDEDLPIPFDDPQMSRRHCQIDVNDAKSFRVQDLNSTNGTIINGRKAARGVVGNGDKVKVGDTIVEFIKAEEVEVEDDTGLRNLSVLKSFVELKPQSAPKPGEKSAVLSRIGSSGQAGVGAGGNRLTLVAEIAHILADVSDRDEGLKMILGGLLEVYPIDRVAVLIRDEERGTLTPAVSKSKEGVHTGVIVSRTICQHVIQSGDAIVTENAVADPRFSSGDSIIEHHVGSVIAAPMKARGILLGVLYACTAEKASRFSDQDLSFLALIGNLVALAILLDRKSIPTGASPA